MHRRLLVILCGLLLLVGCAKPPTEELTETRSLVAYAYASGAAKIAPEQYRIASEALTEAEQLVKSGNYKKASQRLDLARRYSTQALALTVEKKRLWQEEQQRKLAEQRAREEAEKRARELKAKEEAAQKVAKVAPTPSPPSPKPAPPEPVLLDKVEVAAGETLGSIAARKDIYSDVLLWPLIYKANRDQIKDPKEIFPGQILVIPRDKSSEEKDAARQEARELKLFQ